MIILNKKDSFDLKKIKIKVVALKDGLCTVLCIYNVMPQRNLAGKTQAEVIRYGTLFFTSEDNSNLYRK